MISSKWYDRLKFFVQVFMPALATLYFALAGIWGLGGAQEVVATITALTTFLGIFLQVSAAKYRADPDGVIMPDGQLSLKQDSLYDKDQLLVKIHRDDVAK